MKITRAYKLPIFHNPAKWDVVRYTAAEYAHWLRCYTARQLLQNYGTAKLSQFSTAGLGSIANIASHDARGRAKALVESAKATGNKINVPEFTQFVCPGELQSAKKSVEHQHWIKVSGAFGTTTYIPTRLTKPVRRKLAAGWELSTRVDVKNGHAIVFVTKDKPKKIESTKCLGVDIGLNVAVATSDGHIGFNPRPLIARAKQAQRDRSRQHHKVKRGHARMTEIKQKLNIEAKSIAARCRDLGLSLAFESLAVMSNLRIKSMPRWARLHLQRKCYQIADEMGVRVVEVNPAYTSQTCHHCGYVCAANRSGVKFECKKCRHVDHADINAAKNIARKGSRVIGVRRSKNDVFASAKHPSKITRRDQQASQAALAVVGV